MADTVRYLMEDMIPELEDLEKKGYFSRSEIKQIVQKRQDFEYLLKRRSALKTDFFRYIAYEVKLEELRKHRKQAQGIKGKKGPAEVSGVRRVHFIYERATRKFKADLELWLRWLEFCKDSNSTKQLSKVVTKALQRHANISSLWIEAASWEFEHNANVSAARALMQQGLRNCKQDEQMWTEYVRMELLYVQKLRMRRRILGVDNPAEEGAALNAASASTPHADAAAGGPAAAGALAASSAVATAGASATVTTSAAPAPGSVQAAEAASVEVLRGGVARLVISTALSAMPQSLLLRRQLLAALTKFRFPGIKRLRQLVFDDLAQLFSEDPAAWDLRARRYAPAEAAPFDTAAHAKVCAVFVEAVAALPQPAMYEQYISYLSQVLQPLLDAGEVQVEAAAMVGEQLLAALQSAHEVNACSEALYLAWVEKAIALSQPKLALAAARAACERAPSSAVLWEQRITLELQRLQCRPAASAQLGSGTTAGGRHAGSAVQGQAGGILSSAARDEAALLATISAAVRSVPASDAAAVWMQAVNAMTPGSSSFAGLCDLLVHTLSTAGRGPNRGGMGQVAAAFVQKIRDELGVEPARVFYRRVLQGPCPGADFFRAVIEAEEFELHQLSGTTLSQPCSEATSASQISHRGIHTAIAHNLASASTETARHRLKQQQERVSHLFEAALTAYGDCAADLWLKYAAHQQACFEGGGQVYWRAQKALQDPAQFMEDYRTALVSAV